MLQEKNKEVSLSKVLELLWKTLYSVLSVLIPDTLLSDTTYVSRSKF